ncbi:hypothetical protein [Nocardiopsis sp. MG754419]|uniref:hypothetical protein n=1 Tax=Nocardiopsis sp. MG754419 TaxID=2259865 RepID=UPI001BAB3A25|nr:hypothetical protein [Nocardiopsis sp. MG754419]
MLRTARDAPPALPHDTTGTGPPPTGVRALVDHDTEAPRPDDARAAIATARSSALDPPRDGDHRYAHGTGHGDRTRAPTTTGPGPAHRTALGHRDHAHRG